ncbi:hypothetical protein E5554_14740 [Sphingobium sp. PAMC28499]|uniref:hypothetical protein n=1 Tax=Sphingobium sp. PAMC28499 TaxID=2565554 RepID=UPI00109E2FDF|nr:hypothetical protein [Sphingobium sp. PAMC28499]QCB38968.1 hypothetical protein E5554_14740 [Sphingobium sp. PAMC28499]
MALTYSPGFDLLKRDQELRKELLAPFGWQDIDSDIVLRCLKVSLGADIYKTNPDEVSKSLKHDPAALERTFAGLGDAARFFHDRFSITNPSLVPYRIQIVAIATALLNQTYEDCASRLIDWVWLSTYAELFGGTGRQSENAIGDLRSFVDSGIFQWSLRDPPAVRSIAGVKSDFRAARVKALMLALAVRADEVEAGKGSDLVETYGGEAFQFLTMSGVERGDQGARFLVEPAYASEFRVRLLNRQLDEQARARHLISSEAWELIDPDNMQPFTRHRANNLFAYEREAIIKPVAQRMGMTPLRILGDNEAEVEQREGDIGDI